MNVNEYYHNFAKQHGFKNKSDTIGHWIKHGIKTLEKDLDDHAHNAYRVYELAVKYIELNPSKFERILQQEGQDSTHLKQAIQSKSPYECSKRFAAYLVDDPNEYQELKEKLLNDHIILCERQEMKEKEDTRAIENTTDYYSFGHKRNDDNTDVNSFLPIPQSDDGLYTCRYCSSKYKKKMIFDNHEKFCKLSIETGKAHRIRYKYFRCCCKKCGRGQHDACVFKDISGQEQSKWLISNIDYNKIDEIISEQNKRSLKELTRQTLMEAIELFFSTYTHHDYPRVKDTKCGMKKMHWCAVIDACDIRVRRLDNKDGSPRVPDMQAALEEFGSWPEILNACNIYLTSSLPTDHEIE